MTSIMDSTSVSILVQSLSFGLKPPFRGLTSEEYEGLVAAEVRKVLSTYEADEEKYVNEKLQENPVVCVRRPSVKSGSDSNTSSSNLDPLRQQRAESCRRSRINNKVKKAKLKYRHEFITKSLAKNSAALKCMRDVIGHAESKLRSRGYSEAAIQGLRKLTGVDKMNIDSLPELGKEFDESL